VTRWMEVVVVCAVTEGTTNSIEENSKKSGRKTRTKSLQKWSPKYDTIRDAILTCAQ